MVSVELTGPAQFDLALTDQTECVICNQSIEQDHRFLKRRINPGLGFGAGRTARRTLRGYEAMHLIRKGQLVGIAKGDILAQNRGIAQMFGLVA
jgi:hypothetical protein